MVVSVIVEEHTASIFGVYKWSKPIVFGLSLPLENVGVFQSKWSKFRRLGVL